MSISGKWPSGCQSKTAPPLRPRAWGWGLGWVGPHPSYPQQLLWQVAAVIDATVHGHKALEGRPVPDVGVVEAGVEHDDGEGQDVAGVCGWGQRVRVLALVSLPSSALSPFRDQGSAISQPQRSTLSSWLGIRGPTSPPTLNWTPRFKETPAVTCRAPPCLPTPALLLRLAPPPGTSSPSLFRPFERLLLFQLQLRPSSPPSPPSPAAHSVLCLLGSRRTLIVGTTVQGLVTCCLVIWLALWGFWSQSDCSVIHTFTCRGQRAWVEHSGER